MVNRPSSPPSQNATTNGRAESEPEIEDQVGSEGKRMTKIESESDSDSIKEDEDEEERDCIMKNIICESRG